MKIMMIDQVTMSAASIQTEPSLQSRCSPVFFKINCTIRTVISAWQSLTQCIQANLCQRVCHHLVAYPITVKSQTSDKTCLHRRRSILDHVLPNCTTMTLIWKTSMLAVGTHNTITQCDSIINFWTLATIIQVKEVEVVIALVPPSMKWFQAAMKAIVKQRAEFQEHTSSLPQINPRNNMVTQLQQKRNTISTRVIQNTSHCKSFRKSMYFLASRRARTCRMMLLLASKLLEAART